MNVFGPVPSRRLGRSLGINHVSSKTCTYSCIYCQVGRTRSMIAERREFQPPEELTTRVGDRVAELRRRGHPIDYLSFVPDGEPTLDVHLGREIEGVHRTGIPVAVISNGTLLTRPDVRQDLDAATWVSLKVDTVIEKVWRRLNRPHRSLELERILEGMLAFRREFRGILVTETMLVAGVNDTEAEARSTAEFLRRLRPRRAYVSVPTRPPTVEGVHPPDPETITRYYRTLVRELADVELLTGYEGDLFACAGDTDESLLAIAAVHPMREQAVGEMLRRADASWSLVDRLLEDGRLLRVEYGGHRYYLSRPAGMRGPQER